MRKLKKGGEVMLRGGVALVLVVGVLIALEVANAATLGGINTAQIFAQTAPASIDVPEVDHFENPGGDGNLDGDPGPNGGTWEVVSGSWEYSGSSAVQVQNNSPDARAMVNLGVSDHMRLEVEMLNMGAKPTANGTGVLLWADGNSYMFAVYDYHDQRVELRKRSGSTTTVATSGSIGFHTEGVLTVIIDQPNVKVYFDGVERINYNMTGAETSTFGSRTTFGMIAIQDKDTQFDYFLFEDLS